MREILFRGKRIDNGEWVYGNYVFTYDKDNIFSGVIHLIYPIFGKDSVSIDPKSVEQFTGLRDKNGKMIYEGDIVKTAGLRIAMVEWNNYGLYVLSVKDKIISFLLKEKENIEVIGNIHDNPELLEDEDEMGKER